MKEKTNIKVGGCRDYVDVETGEVCTFAVSYEEKEKDFDFRKVYIKSLAAEYDVIGNQKTKVLDYILDHTNRDNVFYGTFEKIAEDTGISRSTVSRCVSALLTADPPFFVRMNHGVLMLNPDIIHYGDHEKKVGMARIFVDSMQKPEFSGQTDFDELEETGT